MSPPQKISPFDRHQFAKELSAVKGLTVVTSDRCEMLYRLSQYASTLPGDIAELGVYKGGTSILLARANPGKIVHSFDTFVGIPNADPTQDRHNNGDFGDVDEHVVNRLAAAGIAVHQGYFPDTAANLNCQYCFVHFDGDTFQSCKDFISYFWPRMTIGGIMMFDDWKFANCPGVERAVLEFCDRDGCWPFHTAKYQVAITVCR